MFTMLLPDYDDNMNLYTFSGSSVAKLVYRPKEVFSQGVPKVTKVSFVLIK